jgi:alpha-L-rhamnosidase
MSNTFSTYDLRVEHLNYSERILGIGNPSPRLSWKNKGLINGDCQTGYEIEIERENSARIFRVASSSQVLVPWPDKPLVFGEWAKLRVRALRGNATGEWSNSITVEAGVLHTSDISADFISPAEIGVLDSPAPEIFTSFALTEEITSARLYATAHGVYDASLNGRNVSDSYLAPGWTSYPHRIRVQTYDVTSLLHKGQNTISFVLGNGWYRGYLGYSGKRAVYGDRLAVCAQLEVTLNSGKVQRIGTDDSWNSRETNIIEDDLYNGSLVALGDEETAEITGVEAVSPGTDELVSDPVPEIRVTDEIRPRKIWTTDKGSLLVDFGQNAVGWVSLRLNEANKDQTVTIKHAEVLENGELSLRPLRAAKATDRYILKADGSYTLEPKFTLHGFRYVQVEGVKSIDLDDIVFKVVGADMERTGWLSTSDSQINRLHENVIWGLKSNFIYVPTDCPQRDERLGWTGDIQVFSPTALYLYDVSSFVESWLRDLELEQYPNGGVPHVVPTDNLDGEDPATAAWGDAATVVPWTIYQRTGDIGILRRQFNSMCAWVNRIRQVAGENHIWDQGFQFGDWLDPSAPPEAPGDAKTRADIVATAYFTRSVEIVAKTAGILGEETVENEYLALLKKVKAAFASEFITESGQMVSDAETAYALALEWDLIPTEEQREGAAHRLADLVRLSDFHVSTGFVGTPIICDALTHTGNIRLAERLLWQTECPSWLYPVTMGATTIWERWDSMLPNGEVNPGEMTSFNHYSLGAVADWIQRTIGGLALTAPGYRKIRIQPRPLHNLKHAETSHISPYGKIEVSWKYEGKILTVDAVIPSGVEAEVLLPGREPFSVDAGTHSWKCEGLPKERKPRTIREFIDWGTGWSNFTSALQRYNIVPAGEKRVLQMLSAYFDSPATEALGIIQYQIFDPKNSFDATHPINKEFRQLFA